MNISTFLGDLNLDWRIAIDDDNYENAFIIGIINSINYPIKNPNNRFDKGFRDIFVTKFFPINHPFIQEVKGGFSLSVIFSSIKDPLIWSINVDETLIGGKKSGTIPPYIKKI